jgi:cell wall-associated NlpC family hydrolase
MASSRTPARRRAPGRTALLALLTAGGVVLTAVPATADPQRPTTSRQAAQLVAARAHDLEVLTEQFNDSREQLKSTREAAALAAEELAAARAELDEARDHVRAVAIGAWTGDRLGTLRAMLTSKSAAEMLDRVGTLQTIAEHNNGVLGGAQRATEDADRAKATSEQLAAEAQAQVDRVSAKKAELDAEIAVYQAAYERLTEEEQRASRAAAERHTREPADVPAPRERAARQTAAAAPAAALAAGSAAAQTAVQTAMAQIGDPYAWGAGGPNAFDCSGLTQYAYAAAGISLPHSSRGQSTMGVPVSRSDLQPGDLLFFYSPVSHVGMYIGNGQMVHASTSGVPVKTASIDSMGSFTSARRIAG